MEERVVSTFDPLPGHRFRTVADCRYRNGDADAALIVAAVNDYDRLRRIERLARELVDGRTPLDTDGETLDQWCHYCESMDAKKHRDHCEWAALRTALGED